MLGEKKQRVRRSVEKRAAALDAKIQTHKEAIKALEEKKAALFRPKKKRRSDAEIAKELIAKAKKSGMSTQEIAEKLGLEME